ncbi:MAG TPA: FtsX-like permease family protein [Angustibacter sp.]|nr:FtsX-like permease family protein [Angustibacter sp.]
MTGLTTARLRSQPGQAVLVGALSGVLALTAVLGLAYARAVGESVQRTLLREAPAAARGVTLTVEGAEPPSPAELLQRLQPEAARSTWAAPLTFAAANGLVGPDDHRVLVPVIARDGACAHVRVAEGTCPSAPGQVLVSRSTAAAAGLRLGQRLDVADASVTSGASRPGLTGLRVVGVYDQVRDVDTFWFGRRLTAGAPGSSDITAGEALLVDFSTLQAGTWQSLATSVDVPLDVRRLTVERVAAARADLEALQRKGSSLGARSSSQLGALLDQAAAQRQRAAAPLPLLALQGVLLALVVLGYVASATTEQRRPEVALARLRGQLPASAARMLVRDLAVVVVAGCVAGGVAGYALARLAARVWLEPGVPVPVDWPLGAAVLACAVVALVAVTVTAVPTVREPLASLLRSVPPRSNALRAGVADGAVVALSVAGLVTLLSESADSPTALIAPGLLALAGGLVLSQVVVPVAGALGRRLLASGRISSGLALLAVSRRPALRRLVAIETVAVALLVFAGAATAVGAQQREVAAQRSVGAPVVLTVAASAPRALERAVAQADPSGRYAAAVVVARPASGTGTSTVAVDPARFAAVALWDDSGRPGAGAVDLRRLTASGAEPVELTGRQLDVDVSFAWAPYTPDQAGPGAAPTEGVLKPVHLVATVVDSAGVLRDVDLGVLPTGRHRLTGAVPCAEGCRLRAVTLVREDSDNGTAELDLVLRAATVDGRPVDLRAGDRGWAPAGFVDEPKVDAVGGVHVSAYSFGASLVLHRLDVPVTLPALTTGGVSSSSYGVADPQVPQDELVSAPALAGADQPLRRVGGVARVPGVPDPAVLVALPLAGELDGALAPSAAAQVWLADDDSARESRLVSRLTAAGLPVLGRVTVDEVATAAGARGPALSLHLATVVGVVALLLAASVLAVAVATSGRVRAHDLAGLRVVGVPAATVRRAAVREQLVVAVAGVVAGAVLGAGGAALTLSRGGVDRALPAADLGSGAPAVGVLVTVSVVVLAGVCVALGARLGRQARPTLLREGAR